MSSSLTVKNVSVFFVAKTTLTANGLNIKYIENISTIDYIKELLFE